MISKLRQPDNNESDDCARLIYISGPHLYSYSFIEKEPEIYELFKLFYKQPGNAYSKENVVVEEENGKIRGLILAYPASDMKILTMKTLKCIKGMFMIAGVLNFIKMLFRLRLNTYLPGLENDEFFISNLAVFEEYRGKGIAVKLLEKAEEMAIEKGLNKLSLYMEIDNSQAERVYEKFGFREVKKVVLPEKYNKHNLFGFYKMLKTIV
ncbi:GNAT family N-acetyltransferase [Chloroflexota bacterium]